MFCVPVLPVVAGLQGLSIITLTVQFWTLDPSCDVKTYVLVPVAKFCVVPLLCCWTEFTVTPVVQALYVTVNAVNPDVGVVAVNTTSIVLVL